LGAGFVPIRKPGKLPFDTHAFHYELEYGQDTLEMHVDGVAPGQRVLVVDDLLATGARLTPAAGCWKNAAPRSSAAPSSSIWSSSEASAESHPTRRSA